MDLVPPGEKSYSGTAEVDDLELTRHSLQATLGALLSEALDDYWHPKAEPLMDELGTEVENGRRQRGDIGTLDGPSSYPASEI